MPPPTSHRPAVVLGVLLLLPSPLAAQQIPVDVDRWNRAALEWVGLLVARDFDAAATRVDPGVPADAMSAARLRQLWDQIGSQLGALVTLEPGPVAEQERYHVVDLAGAFENQSLTVRVVLTDALEVSGFFLRPPEPPPYEAPAYVDRDAFTEEEVTVGREPWELPGVLAMPGGDGPFPALVLVHGSGPNDRDQTLGGNRPFRDLAWGLASRGIAVLRYDKRTRVYGARLPPEIGLDEEVVDDALHALDLVRERPEVDPGRVFVLGHSLGALMAPEIARRDGEVAGAVVAAGPARPFAEVLVGQLEYIAGLEHDPESAAARTLDSLAREVRRYAAGEMAGTDSLLGVRVAYWDELAAVDAVAAARALDIPLLVLQGGRDYQVTEEDLALWREGLAGREDVTFRLYPDLSHLFTPGEGMATPAEYTGEVKHVAPEVVDDLASWIRAAGS